MKSKFRIEEHPMSYAYVEVSDDFDRADELMDDRIETERLNAEAEQRLNDNEDENIL